MNIEELRLVLETIQRLSVDANATAIWWLVLHYGSDLIPNLAWLGSLVWVTFIVVRAIERASSFAKALKDVCKAYGCDDDESFITAEQRRTIRTIVERAKQ